MKKKFVLSTVCVLAIALFFVCQKQSSLNSIIVSNIDALTNNGDNGSNVSITTTTVYKVYQSINNGEYNSIDDQSLYYAGNWDYYPINGTPWEYYEHNIWQKFLIFIGGGIGGEKYWCNLALTNQPTVSHCYEIVVMN